MRKLQKAELRDVMIPSSVFQSELSPMESIVKYLRENQGMSFSEMQPLLKRDQRVLAITYKRSKNKYSADLDTAGFRIPLMIINDELSVMESIVYFLKTNVRMSYSDIGTSLGKNYHTVRTSYLRAIRKMN